MCILDFCLTQVVEKVVQKMKKVYAAYLDLDKAYDKVSRKAPGKLKLCMVCIEDL